MCYGEWCGVCVRYGKWCGVCVMWCVEQYVLYGAVQCERGWYVIETGKMLGDQ